VTPPVSIRPASPAFGGHTVAALALLGLTAAGLLLAGPAARRAEATVERCGSAAAETTHALSLPHLARALAVGRSLLVVALGSSSTYGAGASARDRAYPSRLAAFLAQRLPTAHVTVLNRGVGGEDAAATLRRLDRDVIAAHPDFVIWQVGTNDVLHDADPAAVGAVIRAGVARMQRAGIDVALMDVQFAPTVIRHPGYREIERVIAAEGRALGVPVIRRFAMMREWAEDGRLPLSIMLAGDHLHMTDASYDCLARRIGRSVALAVEAPSPGAYGVSMARP